MLSLDEKTLRRFWKNVSKSDPCWNWTGNKYKDGYGQFSIGYKKYRAHRLSYELHIGDVPEGIYVLHTCDNRVCINPLHLFLGTASDNSRDAFKKGRLIPPVSNGQLNGRAKLTRADVDRIRALYATGIYTQVGLALTYGVSKSTISHIILRYIWK
jgi:hypothetical protein